ncbi:hypothetical protein LUZ63_008713 [Rhynchospora breviuscula]|uniref:Uncharacterized protein n=1 Tax=Rhynchospora breviuscula TaxID=2022672 RepID=A0A9Q0CUB3_9POAL|nr:hypothetical protein LUZ63_008713 [Rhynchospora breviuscula]
MRDPFNSPLHYISISSSDRLSSTHLTPPDESLSRTDFANGVAVAVANPDSATIPSTRNQFNKAPLPNDFANQLDPEIKELYFRTRSLEEEVLVLKKQVTDAGLRELQLLSEKHILERKLSELRIVLDEKQDDAIASTLKELNQKKSHIEENLRLANELKVVEEDVYIFTSSLLSILAENEVRPPIINASTISNGTKRVCQQMNSKLRSLNTSLGGTNADFTNVVTASRNQLSPYMDSRRNDFSQQPQYGLVNQQFELGYERPRFVDDYGMIDPKDLNTTGNSDRLYSSYINDQPREMANALNPNFYDDNSGDGADRRSEYSGDGEEMLPGIEGFQINGIATPGNMLIACGFPTNGTTLCIFQWVRYHENGTRQSIEGATVPEYYVTADDVDTILAVDCTPMDDNGCQGELVRQFANNQSKITCDPEMQHELDSYISSGKASFDIFSLVDSADDWELTLLTLKRSTYQIKIQSTDSVIIEEKYSPELSIKVPYGYSTQFVLVSSNRISVPFTTEGVSQPNSMEYDVRYRDLIVLTMRTFQNKAVDGKRKGKA